MSTNGPGQSEYCCPVYDNIGFWLKQMFTNEKNKKPKIKILNDMNLYKIVN
jgi:hypothetical protein